MTPTPQEHFLIDANTLRLLDSNTIVTLCLSKIIDGKADEAYRLMNATGTQSLAQQIIYTIEDDEKPRFHISNEQRSTLFESFSPYFARILKAKQLEEHSVIYTFEHSESFIKSLSKHVGTQELIALFQHCMPVSFLFDHDRPWRRFKNAFTALPGLLEHTIQTWCTHKLSIDQEKAQKENTLIPISLEGSPGLNYAAALGEVAQFLRCINFMEALGIDPKGAVEQRWINEAQQQTIGDPYSKNSALTVALMCGHIDIVHAILDINPSLDIIQEARFIQKLNGFFASHAIKHGHAHTLESHYNEQSQKTIALAEQILFTRGTAHPTSSSKRPAL